MKLYGSLQNRIMENAIAKETIEVNDDITMYHYTDRTCYYVTEVINQKHIKVKRYNVVADKEKANGIGHQDWLYLKDENDHDEEWVYRYNKWQYKNVYDLETWNAIVERTKKDFKEGTPIEQVESLARFYTQLKDEEIEKIKNGKQVVKYHALHGKIQFGVRDYHYDWEF